MVLYSQNIRKMPKQPNRLTIEYHLPMYLILLLVANDITEERTSKACYAIYQTKLNQYKGKKLYAKNIFNSPNFISIILTTQILDQLRVIMLLH